jgi:RNA polymerase sigma-70 factor (ECF subfamily)
MRNQDTSLGGSGIHFSETAWGMVERARADSPVIRQQALESLARQYWKPVYHYLRVAWARSNEDAKDLAQGFFLWLTDRQAFRRYEPQRGSFRTFLKALLRHFVQHHDEALDRLKRGGGQILLPLDSEDDAPAAVADPRAAEPDLVFEREWRRALMAVAVEQVRRRFQDAGHGAKFHAFEEYTLNAEAGERRTYAAVAARLNLKEQDVKRFLEDVREEIRREIRAQLARTLDRPEDLQEEWNAFFGS